MTLKTTNFVRLYMYAQGKSEVPPAFHLWSCISLIAACVANKVWVEWIKDQPIYPHVFTFLIAPSGLGKNIAITAVEKLILSDPSLKQWVNYYRGKITGPALYDLLGREVPDSEADGGYVKPPSNVWLVTPEVKNSMGSPEMAQLFIETMTELWSACGTTFTDRTRSHNQVSIDNPTVNWIAGTTREWLMRAVKPDDIRGGFFARVLPVYFSSIYPAEKVCKPEYPKDRDYIWENLQDRVYTLCKMEGEVVISSDADARIHQWYENRVKPYEDVLAPYYNRAKEMILKLALLHALADNEKMRIEWKHFDLARRRYQALQRGVLELIELACQTPQTADAKIIEKIIKRAGGKGIARSQVTSKVYSRGIDSKRVEAAVQQLMIMGRVTHKPAKYGKDVFTYVREG